MEAVFGYWNVRGAHDARPLFPRAHSIHVLRGWLFVSGTPICHGTLTRGRPRDGMGEATREVQKVDQGGHETGSKPQYAPLPVLLYSPGMSPNAINTQKRRRDT